MGVLIWQRSHQGTVGNRERAIAYYLKHIEEVKAAVPADRLLVYSVDQGWKPLCDFLGVPVPTTPFPNVNDRAEFKKRITLIKIAAYTILGIGAAILLTTAYGLVRFVA
jgi:Sulfotransferase domain